MHFRPLLLQSGRGPADRLCCGLLTDGNRTLLIVATVGALEQIKAHRKLQRRRELLKAAKRPGNVRGIPKTARTGGALIFL